MSRTRIYARNIFSNYAGQVANLVVMFFLSPFVVHRLGDATYGAWSLVVSLTGYLGLAELGVRAGLGRYVNWYLGKGDIPRVNGVISTALAFLATKSVSSPGPAPWYMGGWPASPTAS